MGKKDKVGKARKDKFYHLAKETGYRARSAFKLIQLNRKYEFLQKSNVIIDLCAAPGGWLQVAAENAPMSNVIIGIDLVRIPPIHNVRTLQEDITTEKCRVALKKELHTAKADCVLNDGAPNVGKSWVHDAYQQAELTLHAMKLATDFLRKGGWFITKIFRSKDYDSLMWVFQQLFKEVNATKPQASRNESAEIFVVCQGYLAPDRIDPKFLDPRHVFKEVDDVKRQAIDLIHPEKKRRQRGGYPEGDYTLFHSLPATKFFQSEDFMQLLAESSEIKLDSEEIKNHPLTTAEVKACIEDIKLLGKKEIKLVFNWRKKLKKELEGEEPEEKDTSEAQEDSAKDPPSESEEETQELNELESLLEAKNQEELKAMRKAKKKVAKAQLKQKQRVNMQMTIPGDRPDINDDVNIFDIKSIRSRADLDEVEKGDLSHMDRDNIFDSDEELEPAKKKRYVFDKEERRYRGIEGGGESEDEESEQEMEEEPEFDEAGSDVDDDDDVDDDEDENTEANQSSNPLVVDMGETSRIRKDKQSSWFKKSAFDGLEDDIEEDLLLDNFAASKQEVRKRKKKESDEKAKAEKKSKGEKSGSSIPDSGVDLNGEISDDSGKENESDNDSDSDSDEEMDIDAKDGDSDSDYDFSQMSQPKTKRKESKKDKKPKLIDGIEVVPKPVDPTLRLNEEGLALGAEMIKSKKRRREIVESGYHRYMFDDDHLPDWFAVDEKKHCRRIRQVTKEDMEEYKLKKKAVDAAPIKKVAEAKARKKQKMLKRAEKARKKANVITENVDVSEKEKWSQIKNIYKKAGLLKKKKPNTTYVVAKKGTGKKVRRPAGVKGQFKVVDSRMKKDVRGMKKAEQRKTGKKQKNKFHRSRT